MQMPGGSRSGRVRAPGRKTVVFFQSQICDGEPGSQRFGHIADVPGLVREAGDLLSVFGIPEDETIERSVLFQPAAFSCCGKPFGELHMDGRTGDIQSKSALMLARTWPGNKRAFRKRAPSVAGRNDIRKLPTGSDHICDRHEKAEKPLLQPGIPEAASDLPVLLQMEVRYR